MLTKDIIADSYRIEINKNTILFLLKDEYGWFWQLSHYTGTRWDAIESKEYYETANQARIDFELDPLNN
jgi:hypothetical protein